MIIRNHMKKIRLKKLLVLPVIALQKLGHLSVQVVKTLQKCLHFFVRLWLRIRKVVLISMFCLSISLGGVTSYWLYQHFSQPHEKYVVLISGGETNYDNRMVHSEYWYDLVMTYKSYIDQGYTHKNIFVFYGQGPGHDFDSRYDHYDIDTYFPEVETIIDYDNSWETIQSGLKEVDFYVTKHDKITIQWVIGHGGVPDGYRGDEYNSYRAYIEGTNQSYHTKEEIYRAINQIDDFKQREIYWMTCHAGSMAVGVNKFSDFRTTILTSSSWDEYSYSSCPGGYDYWWGVGVGGYLSAEFNWVLYGITHRQYFDGTEYPFYHSNLEYPITPAKMYNELKHSSYITSHAQIGGLSPDAVYCYVVDTLDDWYIKAKVPMHKVQRFFKRIWKFRTHIKDTMIYFLGYEPINR